MVIDLFMNKKLTTLILCMALFVPVMAQLTITHPWNGKKVAYFGDSITDPRNKASRTKYWGFLEEWLGFLPNA